MHRTNELIINGESTANLTFYCVVEALDPPRKANKKDKLYETEFSDGYIKQTVNAYEGYPRAYSFYLHDVDYYSLREFKTFIADEGWFTPYDEPDLKFYFEKSTLEFEALDEVNGYEVVVTFDCQPFGIEEEVTRVLDRYITNNTNAPMYPLIEIRGATGSETYLQIGDQRMAFKEIQDVIYIECKPGYQNAWSSGGRKVNGETKGAFFEIYPGKHFVIKGPGITSVKITERWGWR